MKNKIIAGNWKMNLSIEEGLTLVNELKQIAHDTNNEVVIFPTALHLGAFRNLDLGQLHLGAQNFYPNSNGAYTGEIGGNQLSSLNLSYLLIGHSERRSYFNESDAFLKSKVDFAIANNYKVMFCCGESLETRENNAHFDFVKTQLENSLFHLTDQEILNCTIAYEPIWAIGTGVTATSEQAEEMHAAIRQWISAKYSAEIAEQMYILYGGSCNDKNAKELFSCPNIDGGLIGGASLKFDQFIQIINAK